jgi:tryptophanyl-tRNA synthetase
MYKPFGVPVGVDQAPHVEITREIARRFNYFYGPVFPEPEVILTETPKLLGTDRRKMSKSYGNAIDLADDAETVRKKVMSMYTDPARVRADIPGNVEGNPVFTYHDAFNPNVAEVDDLKARYREGKVGDVEVKRKLVAALELTLEPMRQRRAEIVAKPAQLRDIVFDGSRRARAVAQDTMARVRDAMKISYRS